MDRVQLGRALGFGARAAAKTIVQAADAAMSPTPSASAKSSTPPSTTASATPAQPRPAAATTRPAQATTPTPTRRAGNVAEGASRMGRAVFEPVKRHSRELWLQITGSFFALLACSMGAGMWALRAQMRAAFHAAHAHPAALWSADPLKFYVAAAACLMFAYYAVSNFVRAGRSASAHANRNR